MAITEYIYDDDDDDDFALLLCGRAVSFNNGVIGLAYLSRMCNYDTSCGFTTVSICNIATCPSFILCGPQNTVLTFESKVSTINSSNRTSDVNKTPGLKTKTKTKTLKPGFH